MDNNSIPAEVVGESLIPYISDDTNMNLYLGLRACGLTVDESRKHTGVAYTTVRDWRVNNSDFKYWDGPGIRRLRTMYRDRYLTELAIRNITLVLMADAKLLAKDPEKMEGYELKELNTIKKQYNLDKLKGLREANEASTMPVNDTDRAINNILKRKAGE